MIIVLGLPGVGKSTVLNGVKEKKPSYIFVNWGDKMLEIAKAKYGVTDRDKMRSLPTYNQKTIQSLVGEELAKMDAKLGGKLIVDTHCSVLNPVTGTYLPGLPYSILQKMPIEALVLLTGEIDEIAKRRANDPTRTRAVDPKEILAHDAHNRCLLAAYSVLASAPALVVYNRDNHVSEAVDQIVKILH